jgi:predicted GIY-YIG superfamily endonuclease
MGFLYMLEFASGKKYIGITAHSVNERMHAHRSQAARKSSDLLVYKAWRKYGEPTVTVLAEMPREQLAAAEIAAIKEHQTMRPHGYNSSEGGFIPTQEHILKLSKLSRNKVFSEETRKKMSDSAKASNAIEHTKQPRKREKYVTVRIPDDVKEQLHQRADENTRTLAAQVLHYIKQGMANEKTMVL